MLNRHMTRRLQALGLVAAMMTFSAQIAAAAITSDDVIASYQADGFTNIDVRVGLTQIKIEAIKGTTKVETVYDIATGNVLKTETAAVQAGETNAPGVTVRKRNRDFVRESRRSSDDDAEDDRDRGVGNDNDEDDDRASDHGDNHPSSSDDDHDDEDEDEDEDEDDRGGSSDD